MDKRFPILYKRSSTGKDCQWQIEVDGNIITEIWGYCGGKLQSTADTIKEGKNVGRSNETTPELQALLEAQGKWDKKLKGHNYTECLTDAQAGKASSVVEGGILPMLAQSFSKHGDKIVYPAYVQPKLDGHRMIAVTKNGEVALWSRTRKKITGVPHIAKAIQELCVPIPLDGESYNHSYRNKFEELSHFVRQETPTEGHEIVEYHIYDTPIDGTFDERRRVLQSLDIPKNSPLKIVETVMVDSEDDLMLAFEHFLVLGYEGAIVRNAAGEYVNKRSYDLQKIKVFDDAEYCVVGIKEGRGKLQGHAIFTCECGDSTFDVKMKGEQSVLKQYYDDPSLAIGKMLTVQYQGLTNSGLPRFPVGLRIRGE